MGDVIDIVRKSPQVECKLAGDATLFEVEGDMDGEHVVRKLLALTLKPIHDPDTAFIVITLPVLEVLGEWKYDELKEKDDGS